MVQTLAALLSWIAMLTIIMIAVVVAGLWRPGRQARRLAQQQRIGPR